MGQRRTGSLWYGFAFSYFFLKDEQKGMGDCLEESERRDMNGRVERERS
jgi:hypothetical protein